MNENILNSNLFWCIMGILGSGIISFIFHKIAINNKKILYTLSSKKLITNNLSEIDGLDITYQKSPIKDLTTTTINIKSIGKDNIEMKDFAKSSPLCIETSGQFLFKDNIESSLTYNSNPVNSINLNIKEDFSIVQLEYDYFKKDDLITFTFLHTGDLSITGELKKGKISQSNTTNKKSIGDIINIICITFSIFWIVAFGLVISGFEFYIIQCLNLLFNICLGIILMEFYHKNYSNK